MRLMRIKYIALTFLILSFAASSFSQTPGYKNKTIGHPFFNYFSPKEYKSEPSNWCIVQDKRGVMYFGNEKGILEFDGISWRKIKVPFSSSVRSMTIDGSGKIYVCASSDFGYLEPDSAGRLKFKSLLPYLDVKYREYGEMWDVISSSKAVYFKTKDKILRWNGTDIKVWDSVYAFRLYNINDKIYSRNNGTGLMVIDGDSIKLMPDGEYFSDTGVFNMLPFGKDSSTGRERILVTTNVNGLFLSDGSKFYPFKTDDDSFLKASQIYNACITSQGNFAFATQRGGLIIMDHQGHFLQIIDENAGLPTNVIYAVHNDKQGGLWLAANNGIVHCEASSPLSITPLNGLVKYPFHAMLRFNDKFYIADELGVLFRSSGRSSFHMVKGINKPAYKLLDYHGDLIASTNGGVILIDNEKLQKNLLQGSTNMTLPSKFFPERLYALHGDGLTILKEHKTKNEFDLYNTDIDEELNSAIEDKDSSLWIVSLDGGIIHVTDKLDKLQQGIVNKIHHTRYRKESLPGYEWELYDINNKVLLATNNGLFRFDKETGNFVPDSTLGSVFADSNNIVLKITKGENGDLWILANIDGSTELGKAEVQKDGKYSWHPLPVFRRLDLSSVSAMYAEFDSVSQKDRLWLSTDEGLVYYSPKRIKEADSSYPALIRKIALNNDSVIYYGARQSSIQNKSLILPFSNNNISFFVSSVAFDKPEANQYQFFLEGNDGRWSQWTTESRKEFTNLSSGDYRFHVRAKNVYGMISQEDTFAFTVLPPWYLSWWAYIFYVILFILCIFIADKVMRSIVIRKEQDKAKLREADLIKRQAEELETVDRLVRVINNADDIDTLFDSLLEQTVSFIPKAEKAAVFLLEHNDGKFHAAFTLGYNIEKLKAISFSPEELKKRYTDNSEELEKGIYIISNTESLYGDEKFAGINKALSMLVMAVEWGNRLEAYVVFDSFADKNSFDASTARILSRFREHAVSAILKAQSIKVLQEKNDEIIKTQEQLVTQQKLASLGALTAGIAHEIKNPLNFVNNFSEISREILDEMKSELMKNNVDEVMSIANDLKQNLEKINQHGKRADSIVKGMLLHSRGTAGEKVSTDLNDLLDQYVALAYHGMRARDKEFNITIEKYYDETLEKINVVPQDISRVFLNLINNACYAANEKKQRDRNNFSPLLKVSTINSKDKVEIRIWDNGNGVPEDIKEQLFTPFFTTKPTGEGTGLGLSLSHDIVTKMHGGKISFKSKEGEFTEFLIIIPKTI